MALVKAHRANPGADIDAMVTLINQLSTKLAALMAKMDADAGITDTNYASTIGVPDTLQLNT